MSYSPEPPPSDDFFSSFSSSRTTDSYGPSDQELAEIEEEHGDVPEELEEVVAGDAPKVEDPEAFVRRVDGRCTCGHEDLVVFKELDLLLSTGLGNKPRLNPYWIHPKKPQGQ